MSKISISQLINYSCVRYSRLTDLINSEYANSNANNINLYIDLYSILKPLYSSNLIIDDYTEITSCIINMCAHYRYFFRSRYNVETKIYLIWSSNIPYKNKNVYSEYNSKFEYTARTNTKITSLINDNLELLNILCPYIPDIMYVTDLYETGVIAQYISEMQDNYEIPGLFITRDIYNFQLAKGDYSMKVLVPSKQTINNEFVDNSFIVNNLNACYLYANKLKVTIDEERLIQSELLSLLMALSRVPSRNIISLYNLPKAYKSILDLLDSKIIYYSHLYETDPVANYLHIYPDSLKARYFICDIKSQLIHYQIDPAINIHQSMINLYDPDEVKMINNKYFQKYPLDLDRL